MKKKKFDKKLVLNKETVAHLDPQKMDELRGGGTTVIVCITPAISAYLSCYETECKTCPTCPPECN